MPKVYTSAVIAAPIGAVWARVRDFAGMSGWHPAIHDMSIEDGHPADKIGCIRRFEVDGLGKLREQLLDLSDRDHRFTYSILETPTPWTNYVATLALRPITDGDRTFAEWTAEFGCPADQEAEFVEMVGKGVFQIAFDTLNRQFGEAGTAPGRSGDRASHQ